MKLAVVTLALLCILCVGITQGKHGNFPFGNRPGPPMGKSIKPPMEGVNHHMLNDVIQEAMGSGSSEMDLENLFHGAKNNGHNNFLSQLGQMAALRKKHKEGKKHTPTDSIEDGSGEDEDDMSGEDVHDMDRKANKTTVVKTDEVKELLGDISTIVKDVDMPLESLKSELVDKVSMINNAQELSGFLKGVQERYEFPTGKFRASIMDTKFLITRLTEAGYETDPACLNLQREVRTMIPKSGKLPDDFHARFLHAYLMSVSCLSLDNALFHNDLAVLQDLDEGSKRDQVLAALSKVMIGSIRLNKKIAEQSRAVEMVRHMLPEAGVPDNTIIYKRLMTHK